MRWIRLLKFLLSFTSISTIIFAMHFYLSLKDSQQHRGLNLQEDRLKPVKFLDSRPYESAQVKLPKLLKNYKNPCFINEETKNVSCLPYFFVAGWTKSGTTDFWYRLTQHAHVRSGPFKELKWWNMGVPKSPDMRAYLQFFQKDVSDISQSEELRQNALIGDFTHQYSWDNDKFVLDPKNKNRIEPISLSLHRIYNLLPNTKIIFILRDPIDRLLSDYKFFGKGPKSAKDFHEQVIKAIAWWKSCVAIYSVKTCSYGSPQGLPSLRKPLCDLNEGLNDTKGGRTCLNHMWNSSFPAADRLRAALYDIHIVDWIKIFGEKQILIVPFEKYVKDQTKMFNTCILPFLGLRNFTTDEVKLQYKFFKTYGKFNENVLQKDVTMMSATRDVLHNFMQPYNQHFIRIMNSDLTPKCCGAIFWQR